MVAGKKPLQNRVPRKGGKKKEVEARPSRSLQDLQVQVRLALPILHRISGTPKEYGWISVIHGGTNQIHPWCPGKSTDGKQQHPRVGPRALRLVYQVTYSTEDDKTTTLVGEDALSNTLLPFSSTPCQTVEAVVKAVSGPRKGPGARITFNTCKVEEDRDDATLDASFLFADSQEEECPPPNLPLCEPAPSRTFTKLCNVFRCVGPPKARQEGGVVAEEISQFPTGWESERLTLLICLVAAGLLVFVILAIVFTIIIRKRQRSGIHHVQKS